MNNSRYHFMSRPSYMPPNCDCPDQQVSPVTDCRYSRGGEAANRRDEYMDPCGDERHNSRFDKCNEKHMDDKMSSQVPKNLSQKQLLRYISEVSFAQCDISLYLDTHPCDKKALAYFHECTRRRTAAMEEYAKCYGPLTIDTADDTCSESWQWVEQRWPWEGGDC